VVWAVEKLSTIRGVRVSEDRELVSDQIELLNSCSFQSLVSLPIAAAGTERLRLTVDKTVFNDAVEVMLSAPLDVDDKVIVMDISG